MNSTLPNLSITDLFDANDCAGGPSREYSTCLMDEGQTRVDAHNKTSPRHQSPPKTNWSSYRSVKRNTIALSGDIGLLFLWIALNHSQDPDSAELSNRKDAISPVRVIFQSSYHPFG